MSDTTPPQERCDYYVYVIFRPHGVPCYVGKGRGDRWKAHLHTCRQRNSHLVSIFMAAGGTLPTLKVREGITNAEASETEIALIAAIGREANGGPLVNQTDGGEGAPGFRWPQAERERMSAQRRGKKQSPETIEKRRQSMLGREVLPETCAKISAANLGRYRKSRLIGGHALSPETRAKLSAAKLGTRHTPEARAKISVAGMGRKRSPQANAKFVAARIGHVVSEETRAKLRAANIGKTHSAETRELLAEKSRIAWQSRPRKVVTQ